MVSRPSTQIFQQYRGGEDFTSPDLLLHRSKRQFLGAGAYVDPSLGGLTPGQMIADRELEISQARTRQALINSQIATNQATREAAIIGAEATIGDGTYLGAGRLGGY